MSPKPAGSRIEVVEDGEDVTYRWERPDPKILRWLITGVFVVQISVVLGFAIPDMIGQMQRQGAAPAEAIIGATVFGVFALLGVVMFYFLLRKGLPERMMLGRDSFRYDPGRQCALTAWLNPWFMMKYSDPSEAFTKFFRRRKSVELAKGELGRVVLDRAGERQRLYFDYGADRIEIGESLREPEREWLATVIQEWQNEKE